MSSESFNYGPKEKLYVELASFSILEALANYPEIKKKLLLRGSTLCRSLISHTSSCLLPQCRDPRDLDFLYYTEQDIVSESEAEAYPVAWYKPPTHNYKAEFDKFIANVTSWLYSVNRHFTGVYDGVVTVKQNEIVVDPIFVDEPCPSVKIYMDVIFTGTTSTLILPFCIDLASGDPIVKGDATETDIIFPRLGNTLTIPSVSFDTLVAFKLHSAIQYTQGQFEDLTPGIVKDHFAAISLLDQLHDSLRLVKIPSLNGNVLGVPFKTVTKAADKNVVEKLFGPFLHWIKHRRVLSARLSPSNIVLSNIEWQWKDTSTAELSLDYSACITLPGEYPSLHEQSSLKFQVVRDMDGQVAITPIGNYDRFYYRAKDIYDLSLLLSARAPSDGLKARLHMAFASRNDPDDKMSLYLSRPFPQELLIRFWTEDLGNDLAQVPRVDDLMVPIQELLSNY